MHTSELMAVIAGITAVVSVYLGVKSANKSMLESAYVIATKAFQDRQKEDVIKDCAQLLVDGGLEKIDFTTGTSYVKVRAVNYMFKPLSAWCTVGLRYNLPIFYASTHKMLASLLIASMDSKLHVLLYALQVLDGHTPDALRAHRPIIEYLTRYARKDWEESLELNSAVHSMRSLSQLQKKKVRKIEK